jgi:hypothetical protein
LHSLKLKAAALVIGLGALGSVPAAAAVAPTQSSVPNTSSMTRLAAMGPPGATGQSLARSNVERARWRGRGGWRGGRYYGRGWRGGRRWYGGRWIGPAIVAGTAALILGGSIAESQASYGDRWDACADRFQSFRWSDGTYQPYGDNPRRLCPYLRR